MTRFAGFSGPLTRHVLVHGPVNRGKVLRTRGTAPDRGAIREDRHVTAVRSEGSLCAQPERLHAGGVRGGDPGEQPPDPGEVAGPGDDQLGQFIVLGDDRIVEKTVIS